jgi:dipeptidyl-peptidase 4
MRLFHLFALLVVTLCQPFAACGQGTLADYQRAEKFLPQNTLKLVFNAAPQIHWLGQEDRFWYRHDTADGKEFRLVDAARDTVSPAFDHARLAAALARASEKPVAAGNLPFSEFSFINDGKAVRFTVAESDWTCDLATYACALAKKEEPLSFELNSPDGKWVAFVRDFNIFVRAVPGGTVPLAAGEIALSRDGCQDYAYGCRAPDLPALVKAGDKLPDPVIEAQWSPDSRRLLSWRIDQRGVQKHHVVQFAPPGRNRARAYSWFYELPGDEFVTRMEPVVFDVAGRTMTRIDCRPLLEPFLMWEGGGGGTWTEDSRRIFFAATERGYHAVHLYEADPQSGRTRLILTETSSTCVDPGMTWLRILGNGRELIWSSERDGWCHLYRVDGKSGRLRQITSGEFVVRGIVHVDEKARRVYFSAGGREPGRDPYLRHLYRVGLDGSGLKRLTPEAADHEISFSPAGRFFIDTHSTIDSAPVTVLRRAGDGARAREIEKADLTRLLAAGWRFPEPFQAVGRDGKTAIYGAIYRPANFDPKRRYPVIDDIYNGPQHVMTAKSFRLWSGDPALAELGFIVVTVDGMGTAMRSKAFHNVSYRNLGDSGLADHILALRQLAGKYPWLDLERVGVYGHSAGGYDSAHAMLTHPEFYKVAVSSSGCHDNRSDKVWWNELWMDYPVGDHYQQQANPTLAANLRGKLLLVHGDLDDNVHPAATLQLADALIKANKDFDLLIMPNRTHGLGNGYFVRKRWDYFVKNLLAVEPPHEYPLADTAPR